MKLISQCQRKHCQEMKEGDITLRLMKSVNRSVMFLNSKIATTTKIPTTVLKESRFETSASYNEMIDEEGNDDIDDNDPGDDNYNDGAISWICGKRCAQCRKGTGIQKDCPASVNVDSAILIKPLLTSKIDGDYIVYNEEKSFDTTLRILEEIRGKACLPCFTQTTYGKPEIKTPYSPDKQEICKPIKCSFQGRCYRFANNNCYSWTITVISEKQKYVLFSHTNAFSDKETNLNVTCVDTGTAYLSSRPTKSTLQPTVVNTDSVTENTTKSKQENFSKNALQPSVTNTDSVIGKTKKNKQKKTPTTGQEGNVHIDDNEDNYDVDNGIDHNKDELRYAVILIKPLLTAEFDGDSSVYAGLTRFDTTLRILDEIRDNSVLPCLTRTNSWSRPKLNPPHSTTENQKVCKAIQCSFQGSCLRFNTDRCNSWTITIILEKRKYVLYSNISAFYKDEDNNLNVTCYDTGTIKSQPMTPALRESQAKMKRKRRNTGIETCKEKCIKDCKNMAVKTDIATTTEFSTTVSKESRLGTSTSANATTDQERNGDFIDDKNDGYSGSGDNDNDSVKKNCGDAQPTKPQYIGRCRKKLTECRNSLANQKDCLSSDNVGILFITHVIAAGFGAGILYFIQIVKKIRDKRNDESKPDTNEGMVNVSYGHTRGADILPISNVNRQEEAIYNEVDDTPCTVLIDHTSSNCSAGSMLNNRKHSKLPDIPTENEKDKDYLLP